MSRIKLLLQVCAASMLSISTAFAGVAQPTQPYGIRDLMNDKLLSQDIKVLVQIKKITGKDIHGQRQVLYENKAGMLVHLDLLTSMVQRLDGRSIPPGRYDEIQLELSNDVHLFGHNSIVLRVPISDQNGTAIIKAEGEIDVSPARVVTAQIEIEMGEFYRPLRHAIVQALFAATPKLGCDVGAVC